MHIQTMILAGAAALALAATGAIAASTPGDVHTMTVQLPDGGVATIQYAGDVKPKVSVDNSFAVPADGFAAPVASWPDPIYAPSPAFVRLSREMTAVEAQMDRQMADMQKVFARMPMPDLNAPMTASFSNLPAGTESYSFVSTSSGGKTCARMTTVTANGQGKPHVVTKVSGDCGAFAHTALPKSAI